MFSDKVLVCRDCGEEFVFTAGEQEFYAQRGFTKDPQRCYSCRKRRKHSTDENTTVLYEIVCAKCGEIEQIPFEPRHNRPVYCGKCYREMKGQEGEA